MSDQANFVQEGVDRVREAFESIDDELQRTQRRIKTSRRDIEKQLRNGRRDLEKQVQGRRKEIEKRAKKLQTEFRKSSIGKRALSFQRDAQKRIEKNSQSVLGLFQIASKGELQRIDKKLTQINRKLTALEKTRSAKAS